MRERIKIKFFGLIQGVGFRYAVKQMASKLNLNGWIKNQPDGSVEALIEGRQEDLKKFLNQTGKGTISAKVEEVKVVRQRRICLRRKKQMTKDNSKNFEIKF